MTYYNLTNVTSSNNFAEMFVESSKLAGGNTMGLIIVLATVIIAYVAMKNRYDSQTCLLAASFIGTLVAGLLAFTQLELLSQNVFWAIVIVLMLTYVAVTRLGKT